MEIRTLRYFLTIAEEGSITKAAKKLNMAQPPLSTQMMHLEDELGVILFIRGKKQIQLTEAGAFLKSRAEELVAAYDALERQVKDYQYGTTGKISIGTIEAIGTKYLAPMIASFHKKYPRVEFDIWCGGTDDILDRIDKGIFDIAIVRPFFEKAKYLSYELSVDAWGVLIPEGHPLAKCEEEYITPDMLKNEPLIIPSTIKRQTEIIEWFAEADIEPNIVYSYNVLSIAESLVSENAGIALVLVGNQFDGLTYKEIRPRVGSSVNLVWSKSFYLSEPASRFVEYLREENHIQKV